MLPPILIGLAFIAAVFVIIVSLQPGAFRVERAAAISAPPAAVFAHVNDFHKWEAWSSWAKIDPALRTTYDGPPSGVGTIYHWAGNNKVGEGRITILESRSGELIRIKLEFIKPFAATNATDFSFTPRPVGPMSNGP